MSLQLEASGDSIEESEITAVQSEGNPKHASSRLLVFGSFHGAFSFTQEYLKALRLFRKIRIFDSQYPSPRLLLPCGDFTCEISMSFIVSGRHLMPLQTKMKDPISVSLDRYSSNYFTSRRVAVVKHVMNNDCVIQQPLVDGLGSSQ